MYGEIMFADEKLPCGEFLNCSCKKEESEFNFDLERMKIAVEGETIQIPQGLRGKELKEFILNNKPSTSVEYKHLDMHNAPSVQYKFLEESDNV